MNNVQIDFGNDGVVVLAELVVDGDQWCVGVGCDLQEGVYAFDPNPLAAISKFRDAFRNESLKTPVKSGVDNDQR